MKINSIIALDEKELTNSIIGGGDCSCFCIQHDASKIYFLGTTIGHEVCKDSCTDKNYKYYDCLPQRLGYISNITDNKNYM